MDNLDWPTEENKMLHKEIERLKSHISRLRYGLNGCAEILMEPRNADHPPEMYAHEIRLLLRETPAQSLREIQAEAGREGYIAASVQIIGCPDDDHYMIESANEYADRIRRESDER